jgi:SNF2 family DNA or RNA helicase
LEKFGDPEKIPRYLLFSILNSEASLPVDEPLKEFLRQVRTFFAPPNKDKHPFLKSYQEYGVAWMRHLLIHGCHPLLADEMGLGKTLQVLALLRHFPSIGKPDLIVCPASVTGTWESQAAEFFPELKITPVENEISPTDEPVVFLGSYGQIRARAESQASFRFVILDEAQCIKNPDSQTALACLKLQSQYRLALTGTPIENRFLDLWTLFQFLMPGLLGSRKAFEAQMMEPDATDRLRDQLGPFILRRTKEEVAAELPPKISTTVSCPMSESQKEHYEKILRGRDQLRTGEWRSLFTLLLRLRQASCDVGLLPGQASTDVQASSKTQWLKLKLEECVSQGRKVVIFSQFRRWLERLFPMVHDLYGGRSFTLFGDTMDRTERVNAFQTLDSPAAFLATLRTGYAGITLHAAHTVFLLDPWWNPSVEAQAVDRLHRIGQRKTVWIYRLLAKDSVEEKVQQLQQIKRGYFDAILGSTSQSEKGKWETLVRLLG